MAMIFGWHRHRLRHFGAPHNKINSRTGDWHRQNTNTLRMCRQQTKNRRTHTQHTRKQNIRRKCRKKKKWIRKSKKGFPSSCLPAPFTHTRKRWLHVLLNSLWRMSSSPPPPSSRVLGSLRTRYSYEFFGSTNKHKHCRSMRSNTFGAWNILEYKVIKFAGCPLTMVNGDAVQSAILCGEGAEPNNRIFYIHACWVCCDESEIKMWFFVMHRDWASASSGLPMTKFDTRIHFELG